MTRRGSRFLSLFSVLVFSGTMLMVTTDAEAKRLGGGGSFGQRSSNITQRQATPPAAPQTPMQNQAAAPAAAGAATAGAASAATRSGASRWLGPVAGIAAGLGLAALFMHLGLGAAMAEMLGSLLLIGLLVFAVIFLVRRFMRGASPQPAMAGAGQQTWRAADPASSSASMARASATAVGGGAAASAHGVGSLATGQSAPTNNAFGIPADFDVQGFLQGAKRQFMSLQAAWDSGNVETLREFLTDDMMLEIQQQLSARQGENVTEVPLLNAELLGIEDLSGAYLASVRFSGMMREERDGETRRFEEVWNFLKEPNGGWMLAGIQQIN